MRVVQLYHPTAGRKLARVEDTYLRTLKGYRSLWELAVAADSRNSSIEQVVYFAGIDGELRYDSIYSGGSPWRLLPAFDHPEDPSRCIVSGTGLTHTGSATGRNQMHVDRKNLEQNETDSMKMFRWGTEGGKPSMGEVGTAPEWFYKGTGDILRAHGEKLCIPHFAESGGEEPEIAGLYIIGHNGQPRRVGFATGNEFSDHSFERRNYLYLAHSKLRVCSLGPEAVIGEPLPSNLPGRVTIYRNGKVLWEKGLSTGEDNMCHSVANIEYHHFKYASHRRPGIAHVHFFGAADLSFKAGIRLEAGDSVSICWDGLGRPLRNEIAVLSGDTSSAAPVSPL